MKHIIETALMSWWKIFPFPTCKEYSDVQLDSPFIKKLVNWVHLKPHRKYMLPLVFCFSLMKCLPNTAWLVRSNVLDYSSRFVGYYSLIESSILIPGSKRMIFNHDSLHLQGTIARHPTYALNLVIVKCFLTLPSDKISLWKLQVIVVDLHTTS